MRKELRGWLRKLRKEFRQSEIQLNQTQMLLKGSRAEAGRLADENVALRMDVADMRKARHAMWVVEYGHECEVCFQVEAVRSVLAELSPEDLNEAQVTEYAEVRELAASHWLSERKEAKHWLSEHRGG